MAGLAVLCVSATLGLVAIHCVQMQEVEAKLDAMTGQLGRLEQQLSGARTALDAAQAVAETQSEQAVAVAEIQYDAVERLRGAMVMLVQVLQSIFEGA